MDAYSKDDDNKGNIPVQLKHRHKKSKSGGK